MRRRACDRSEPPPIFSSTNRAMLPVLVCGSRSSIDHVAGTKTVTVGTAVAPCASGTIDLLSGGSLFRPGVGVGLLHEVREGSLEVIEISFCGGEQLLLVRQQIILMFAASDVMAARSLSSPAIRSRAFVQFPTRSDSR